jgi:hypothetical protein
MGAPLLENKNECGHETDERLESRNQKTIWQYKIMEYCALKTLYYLHGSQDHGRQLVRYIKQGCATKVFNQLENPGCGSSNDSAKHFVAPLSAANVIPHHPSDQTLNYFASHNNILLQFSFPCANNCVCVLFFWNIQTFLVYRRADWESKTYFS